MATSEDINMAIDKPASRGPQGSFDVLGTEAHEPTPVLHSDDLHSRAGKQRDQLAALAVQSRADLSYGPATAMPRSFRCRATRPT